jgi:hypothetical protein
MKGEEPSEIRKAGNTTSWSCGCDHSISLGKGMGRSAGQPAISTCNIQVHHGVCCGRVTEKSGAPHCGALSPAIERGQTNEVQKARSAVHCNCAFANTKPQSKVRRAHRLNNSWSICVDLCLCRGRLKRTCPSACKMSDLLEVPIKPVNHTMIEVHLVAIAPINR